MPNSGHGTRLHDLMEWDWRNCKFCFHYTLIILNYMQDFWKVTWSHNCSQNLTLSSLFGPLILELTIIYILNVFYMITSHYLSKNNSKIHILNVFCMITLLNLSKNNSKILILNVFSMITLHNLRKINSKIFARDLLILFRWNLAEI